MACEQGRQKMEEGESQGLEGDKEAMTGLNFLVELASTEQLLCQAWFSRWLCLVQLTDPSQSPQEVGTLTNFPTLQMWPQTR